MNRYNILIYTLLLFGTINAMEQEKRTITPLENAGIGIAAAGAEVAIDQPLVYFKNTLQRGQKINWSKPKEWYRGGGVNLASLAPTTALQVAVNGILSNYMGHDASISKQFVAAWLAGAASGLICCPSENLMLHQQISKSSATKTAKELWKKHGKASLSRGMLPLCLRDGGFTCGYLALGPAIKQYLKQYSDSTMLSMGGCVFAGLLAATVTHPFDRVKTAMQEDLSSKQGMIGTARLMLSKGGLAELFKGYIPRTTRVAMAIPIMGTVTEYLQERAASKKDKSDS